MVLALGGVLALGAFALAMVPSNVVPAGGTPTVQATASAINTGSDGGTDQVQVVELTALGTGVYDKDKIYVKAGIPVEFRFNAQREAGCGRQLVIPDYNVNLISSNGETVSARFTPTAGTHNYRCGMNMFRGELIAQ